VSYGIVDTDCSTTVALSSISLLLHFLESCDGSPLLLPLSLLLPVLLPLQSNFLPLCSNCRLSP
jgi:hypothetical protein